MFIFILLLWSLLPTPFFQVMGRVPTISINKTEGCHLYLSEDALDCEIVSAKSSEMNVLLPQGDDYVSTFQKPIQNVTWHVHISILGEWLISYSLTNVICRQLHRPVRETTASHVKAEWDWINLISLESEIRHLGLWLLLDGSRRRSTWRMLTVWGGRRQQTKSFNEHALWKGAMPARWVSQQLSQERSTNRLISLSRDIHTRLGFLQLYPHMPHAVAWNSSSEFQA